MVLDIHNYPRRVSSVLDKIRKDEQISDSNKLLILKYHQHLEACGISAGRVMKYLYHLRSINNMMKMDFEKATRDDMEKLMQYLEKSNYKDNTKKDFKVVVKRFWQWMKDFPDKRYPPEVDFIGPHNARTMFYFHDSVNRRDNIEQVLNELKESSKNRN